jgi:hypothetical protein
MSLSGSAIFYEALEFYGRLFEFDLRGKSKNSAFIDLGDQLLALQKGRKQPPRRRPSGDLNTGPVETSGSDPRQSPRRGPEVEVRYRRPNGSAYWGSRFAGPYFTR